MDALLPAQDLADTAIGHLQDARDVARTRSRMGQLDDLLARRVGQRTTADEHAAQLIDAAVT